MSFWKKLFGGGSGSEGGGDAGGAPARSAELFNGNEYRGSWAWKRDKSLRGKWNYSAVVYSRKPYYRIAHLLENGHAKVNGGFVEGRPHIAPAAKRAEQILTMYIKQAIADIRAGRTDWRGK